MSEEQRASYQNTVRRPQRHYTLTEVARRLNVRRRTVLDWIASGRLTALRLSPRTFRVTEEDLEAFVARSRTPDGAR